MRSLVFELWLLANAVSTKISCGDQNIVYIIYLLDSSVGRVSTFGAGSCVFKSWPHQTKGVKNGSSSSLADARIKGGCARKIE